MPTNILMPALSPTMEEGTLAKWLKKEGDTIKAGDILAEIETDKATMEVEAVDEGTLSKILIADGTEGVKVNTPIAVLTAEGEDASAAAPAAKPEPKAAPAAERSQSPNPTTAEPAPKPKRRRRQPAAAAAAPTPAERVFASPLARRLAGDGKLDLKRIPAPAPTAASSRPTSKKPGRRPAEGDRTPPPAKRLRPPPDHACIARRAHARRLPPRRPPVLQGRQLRFRPARLHAQDDRQRLTDAKPTSRTSTSPSTSRLDALLAARERSTRNRPSDGRAPTSSRSTTSSSRPSPRR